MPGAQRVKVRLVQDERWGRRQRPGMQAPSKEFGYFFLSAMKGHCMT